MVLVRYSNLSHNSLTHYHQLLGRYFNLLQELATSNAPDQAYREIGQVVQNLNTIGNKLRGSNLVQNKGVFQLGAAIVINGQIRGALRRELEQRKELIRQEFVTQQVLLRALGKSIETDVASIISSRQRRQVFQPLMTNAIADEDKWVEDRRTLFLSTTLVSEFEAAQDAAAAFGATFDGLISGTLNRERLNTLLDDISIFLTFAERLKNH